MNAELTNIKNKVDDKVAAKATATPDPSKVTAADTAELFNEILTYLDTAIAPPPSNPAGVSFTTAPSFTIGTNSIAESASVVNDNGATVNVTGATLSVPYAATGKKRLDSIVVNYLATPAVYERIAGDEVASTAIAARKPIPANRLFAHDIDVTDGAVATTTPTNAHQQNTDLGTSEPTFIIQRNSQNQDPDGVTVLGFGTQQDGKVCAIGLVWENDSGGESYAFKACYNYTIGGSNTWVDFGGSSYTDAMAIAALLTGFTLFPTNTDVAATDSVFTAIRKLAKKIVDNTTSIEGRANKKLTINTQTASYTLALTDAAGMVRMNVASANTLTVPPNSSVAFEIGTQIVWSQPGAGQTTFVAGSGVTIDSFLGLKSAGQKAGGTLIKVDTNAWELHGMVTA